MQSIKLCIDVEKDDHGVGRSRFIDLTLQLHRARCSFPVDAAKAIIIGIVPHTDDARRIFQQAARSAAVAKGMAGWQAEAG